jgi:hypothetical protein
MSMTKRILFSLLLIAAGKMCWAGDNQSRLQVDVKRVGRIYTLSANIDTSLSKCAAYKYLTDYDAAKDLPGVIESLAYRQSDNQVKVERVADERILFFHVRIHSVMEYTEQPFDKVSFVQVWGDSRMFKGRWEIEPTQQGSTLRFQGLWEPDTFLPFFIIDHFAKGGLFDKFSDIANLAEKLKSSLSASCPKQEMVANSGITSATGEHLLAQGGRIRN